MLELRGESQEEARHPAEPGKDALAEGTSMCKADVMGAGRRLAHSRSRMEFVWAAGEQARVVGGAKGGLVLVDCDSECGFFSKINEKPVV